MTGERTTEAMAAYAKRSAAWRHGDKTEDMLLQRIWNLAEDVVALAARLAAVEAERERAQIRAGHWRMKEEATRAERDEARDALTELRVATAECLDEFEMVVPAAAAGLPGDQPWQRAQRRLRAALARSTESEPST